MVGTTGGDEHWFAVVSLNDALTDYYRSDLRASTAQLSNQASPMGRGTVISRRTSRSASARPSDGRPAMVGR
jgi:hypothetical protein